MKIFEFKGIPVKIHFSFWFLFVFLLASPLFEGDVDKVLFIVSVGIGLFASVIMHEFGHALMARKFNIKTQSITLYPFGGIALLTSEPKTSKSELYIALAGPATNIILCCALFPLIHLFEVQFLGHLFIINMVMGIFNLVPAFPMDGGRVLRAVLALKVSRRKATLWSLVMSRIFALLFIIGGGIFGYWDLVLIGCVVFFLATVENKRLQA